VTECCRRSRPIVIGTTGHEDADLRHIQEAGRLIPVLMAPNMSVGVNVLLRLAEQLGATLDSTYDVEIIESHHRFKADAPSGTALALKDAVSQGRQSAGGPAPSVVYGRHGPTDERTTGQIGLHSLRIGDTVGEHAVSFGNLGETITISHAAHSRDTFAAGALRAAKWLVGRPAGFYTMQDVLFGGQHFT
jgi:4-hydroxy-tetrahydrodipicolinate reductase